MHPVARLLKNPGAPRRRILIACEFSGTVRDAFAAVGYDAWSCDLLPSDKPGNHIQGDCMEAISRGWDDIIMHPPCTAITVSGNAHYGEGKPRAAERERAIKWTWELWHHAKAHAQRVAMENPIGMLSRTMKPSQIIQPHQFGHDASKATCLWLHGFPLLRPTENFPPRIVNGKPRWGNQCDSGQNKLGPSPDRWALRSLTYPGIANAMAQQWKEAP